MRYRRIPNLGDDYISLQQRMQNVERIVQAIGFTPDFPYTLNVNDGTRNRVEVGKIGADYGIRIVNNAGVEIVFADGHITASGITTGTLDASIVNVTNLNASNIITGTLDASIATIININASNINTGALNADLITTGHMNGDRITARSVKADRLKAYSITADELSTGEIITQSAQIKEALITNAHINDLDAGKINAGIINVDRINANSIVAGKLSISELSDISGNVGVLTSGRLNGVNCQSMGVYGDYAAFMGQLQCESMHIGTSSELMDDNDLAVNSDITCGGEVDCDNADIHGWLSVNEWASLGGDLDMNGHDITEIGDLKYACAVYVGKDSSMKILSSVNTSVVNTEETERGWKKMSHENIHPAIKATWKKNKIRKRDKEFVTIKGVRGVKKETYIEQEDMEGFSLNKLVMLQNKALLELNERIKKLERKK